MTLELGIVYAPGEGALPFEQPLMGRLRRALGPVMLNQTIEGVPLLVHGMLKVLSLPANGDEDFLQMPGAAHTTFALVRCSGTVNHSETPYFLSQFVSVW